MYFWNVFLDLFVIDKHLGADGLAEQTSTALKGTFFWNLYGRFYDAVYHLMPYRKLLWDTYQALDLKPGMKILDAGCGTGNFEIFLAEKNAPPVQIEAIDFSPFMLFRAKKKCKDLRYPCNFILSDLNQKLNFSDNTFDRIISINGISSPKYSLFAFKELFRVLKPQGKILIANPKSDTKFVPVFKDQLKMVKNIWGLKRRILALFRTLAMMMTGGGPILLNMLMNKQKKKKQRHRFLTKEELIAIFKKINFHNTILRPLYANQAWFVSSIKPTNLDLTSVDGMMDIGVNGTPLVIPVKVDRDRRLNYETHGFLATFSRTFLVPLFNLLPASIGGFIFTSFSKDSKKVKENIASHVALEVMYAFPERKEKGETNTLDFFWENFLSNARAIRNRLELTKKQLHTAILDVARIHDEITILSLGSGSGRAIIEVLFELKKFNIRARLVDASRGALSYSKSLAKEYGVADRLELVRGYAQKFDEYCNDFRPNIVEMVGLLDYCLQEEAIDLVKKIYKILSAGGWLITCNICNNWERPFVTKSIGWPLIYRSYDDLIDILLNAGFPPESSSIIYEPLKIHALSIAKKDYLF